MIQPEIRIQSGLIVLVSILQIALRAGGFFKVGQSGSAPQQTIAQAALARAVAEPAAVHPKPTPQVTANEKDFEKF